MNLKLKICGLKSPQNIQAVQKLCPDWMGFIFYPASQRYVGDEPKIFEIAFPNKVAVFVNQEISFILNICQKGAFRWVQLHGDESPDFCAALRNVADLKIIKAFGVDEAFDFESLASYLSIVDYFLFDTKGKYYGGNGQAFDWNVLKKYPYTKPFFLSGGISLENIDELLDFVNANSLPIIALDVNSRFELSAGIKDLSKLEVLSLRLHQDLDTRNIPENTPKP